ncbi:MAG TPA: hypothetical protein VN678_10140, partial [Acidobacteriaceae bacterium]|nr:hypothetical protein [Acidobacteriaceae bacterium]
MRTLPVTLVAALVASQLALAQSSTAPPNPPSFGGQPPASEAAVRQAAGDQPEQKAAVPAALPIFKVFQFPADQVPRIDGDPSDWAMVPDSYAITLVDMHDDEHKHAAPDPKDLSIKVKVGWVKGLHRLYFLYEADDNYWDFADPGLHNDTFEIVVDGDRSGGPLVPQFRN